MRKCLYCDNMTTQETIHFVSACCGRGMCDECYGNLQGTEEQFQLNYMEDEDYYRYIHNRGFKGFDYVCFGCVKARPEWYVQFHLLKDKFINLIK